MVEQCNIDNAIRDSADEAAKKIIFADVLDAEVFDILGNDYIIVPNIGGGNCLPLTAEHIMILEGLQQSNAIAFREVIANKTKDLQNIFTILKKLIPLPESAKRNPIGFPYPKKK